MNHASSQKPAKVGRPSVGPKIQVHLPAELLSRVDDLARAEGITRSDVIRRLLSDALA